MLRGDNIAQRLVALAAGVVKLASGLPKDQPGRHITSQLTRAATSGGANYEEARGAESRMDFVHKLRVADKEMRETKYWLDLIGSCWDTHSETAAGLAREADELISILTASIRTASGGRGSDEGRGI
jgi:four helix bundle protein